MVSVVAVKVPVGVAFMRVFSTVAAIASVMMNDIAV
jgi:hypothetical protein